MFTKIKYSQNLRLDTAGILVSVVAFLLAAIPALHIDVLYFIALLLGSSMRFVFDYRKIPATVPVLVGVANANLPYRVFAYIVDLFLSLGLGLLALFGNILLEKGSQTLLTGILTIPLAIVGMFAVPLYYILFTLSRLRATPGQLIFSLSIAPNNPEQQLTKKNIILRGIVKSLCYLFPYIYLVGFFTKNRQTLHDFAGHTRLVQPVYQYSQTQAVQTQQSPQVPSPTQQPQ